MIGFNHQVFEAFPVIETDSLLLRNIVIEDAQKILEFRQNERISAFIHRDRMDSIESAHGLIQRVIKGYEDKSMIAWGGVLKSSNTFIGSCGFNKIDTQNLRAEIGGEMSPDAWGKRIAAKAVKQIIQFGFETMNLHSIEARVSPNNRSAIYLLEQMGFIKEAHFKDYYQYQEQWHSLAVYTAFQK
jgi:ribosomal-protein-alanine N-acetyltransferase